MATLVLFGFDGPDASLMRGGNDSQTDPVCGVSTDDLSEVVERHLTKKLQLGSESIRGAIW